MASARGVPIGEDDLSRQRHKREARLLDQTVTGFPAMTVGDVVQAVAAATEESGGDLDARRFLADRGHHRRTIDTVLAYVDRAGPGVTPRSDVPR